MNNEDRGLNQAIAVMRNIAELVEAYDSASDDMERDEVAESIFAYPLGVSFRSEWYSYGDKPDYNNPAEYRIELVYGGPAVWIQGSLDKYGGPETALLCYSDWDSKGIYRDADEQILISFAEHFTCMG